MKTSLFPFRSLLLALMALLFTLTVRAQTRQTRQVGTFSGIQINGALTATIRQGSETSVVVETDEDLQGKIITEVERGVLKIHRDKKFNWKDFNNKKVKIWIVCPELTSLEVHGASEVKGESAFVANEFKLTVSGASNVTLGLSTKELRAQASGASSIRLIGRADRQQINLSGASSFQGYDLESKHTEVKASGASSAKVQVSEELEAQVSGASGLRYKGSPRVRNVQSSGASSIKKAE
jgi:hypothetical protein